MELIQQDVPPDLFQLFVGVERAPGYQGCGRPEPRFPHQVLAAAVALVDLDLAREGPAVSFEVELARPDRRMGVLVLGGGIRTLEDLHAMTAAGATRIGASASVKIVEATAA